MILEKHFKKGFRSEGEANFVMYILFYYVQWAAFMKFGMSDLILM